MCICELLHFLCCNDGTVNAIYDLMIIHTEKHIFFLCESFVSTAAQADICFLLISFFHLWKMCSVCVCVCVCVDIFNLQNLFLLEQFAAGVGLYSVSLFSHNAFFELTRLGYIAAPVQLLKCYRAHFNLKSCSLEDFDVCIVEKPIFLA